MVIVRPIEAKDHEAWLPLWNAYLTFYNETLPAEVTQATWERFFDPKSVIQAHVAIEGDVMLGFSTSVIHEATWTSKLTCYLEDLFVSENTRGKGVGRKLIQNLIDTGEKEGWSRVYWHTNDDNHTARKLYDSFLPADKYVRYRITLDQAD